MLTTMCSRPGSRHSGIRFGHTGAVAVSTGRPAVLAVCTGNICRSPAVERLLQAGLGDRFDVSSAGTGAMVGAPIDAPMARLLEAEGVDTSGFAARRLTAELVRGADLVLALTREHRSAVVRLAPAALRRTFTLRELARLWSLANLHDLPTDPAARLGELLVRVKATRAHSAGKLTDSTDDSDDVVDPYRGDEALFVESWQQLAPAVETITRALTVSAVDPAR